MPEPGGRDAARPVPSRVTMPLLSLISEQTLEEDYQEAARRRVDESGSSAPSGRRRGWSWGGGRGRLAAVVVALFGVLIATAAVQTSQNATVRDAGRAELVARIERERAVVADQQEQVAEVRSLSTDTEAALVDLRREVAETTARQESLATTTGFVPVTGEGVRVTLDQAPDAAEDGVLRDTDLALMVNAWWSAGAEAIAVNGQRLTAASAIRTSGQAIEVNEVGVAPPYVVSVVGDRDTLQADFFETSSGLAFSDLVSRYGFLFERQNADDLSLPAAPSSMERLRSATSTLPDPDDPAQGRGPGAPDLPPTDQRDQRDRTDQEVAP